MYLTQIVEKPGGVLNSVLPGKSDLSLFAGTVFLSLEYGNVRF
jgi:hypothetical protein